MIILDTDVISELMRPEPSPTVVDWIDAQNANAPHLSAVTLAELLYGIARLPNGHRKQNLATQVEGMVVEDLEHRVVAFDEAAAAHYGDIVAQRERAGRPISAADAQIAATCRSHGALLATRNTSDFAETSVTLINPWST